MEREQARRIIESQILVSEPTTLKNVRVSNVSFTNPTTGSPWEWEQTKKPYAIVSLMAMNQYGLNQAIEDFNNGDYDGAVSHSMSMRVDPALGKELLGTKLANVSFEMRELKSGESALLPVRASAPVLPEGKKISIGGLIGENASTEMPSSRENINIFNNENIAVPEGMEEEKPLSV